MPDMSNMSEEDLKKMMESMGGAAGGAGEAPPPNEPEPDVSIEEVGYDTSNNMLSIMGRGRMLQMGN